ncbi:MAG: helix-turn-helix domain-containing protein [Sulfolobaceae archaeon]
MNIYIRKSIIKIVYGKYILNVANIELLHDNCWSRNVEYGIEIESLGRIIYPERNTIRAFLVVNNQGKYLIKKLRDEGKIKDILNISQYNNKLVLDILEDYTNSILKILNDNGLLVIKVVKRNGKEFWSVIGYEYQISKTLKEVSEVAKIEHIVIEEFNIASLRPTLTDSEIRSLIVAMQMGYFDYPKRATASEVAKVLGIKKSTFIYHIRNAQKKLIRALINMNNIQNTSE